MNITKASLKPPCPELRGNIESMKYPAFAEIKVDGEFQFIMINKEANHKQCINKYGTIKEDFNALRSLEPKSTCVLLGELFYKNGLAGEFYDMQSNQDDSENFKLCVFDIVMINDEDVRHHPLVARKEIIMDLGLKSYMPIINVVQNKTDVEHEFVKAMALKAEGIVVKNLDDPLVFGPCAWVKMKYKDQNDYQVTFVDPTLERIEVGVPNPNSPQGMNLVAVGVKACNRYKRFIKLGDTVTIEHQGVLASGSLRHPVLIPKPEWK